MDFNFRLFSGFALLAGQNTGISLRAVDFGNRVLKITGPALSRINQEKASAEIRGEFFQQNSQVNEFCGDFFWWIFSGLFPWRKQEEKIHPKIHSKIQIRIWEFCGQNPTLQVPVLSRIFIRQSFRCGQSIATRAAMYMTLWA